MENIMLFKQEKINKVYIESKPEEECGFDWEFDIGYDKIGDNSYYPLTNIDNVINALEELKKAGANYVEIDVNTDHDELEITGYNFRKASFEEHQAYQQERKVDEEKDRQLQIKILEEKLSKLKNEI